MRLRRRRRRVLKSAWITPSCAIIEGDGLNMPAGWLISFAQPTGDVFSIVGEAAGNCKSEEGETLKLHTFQAGVRGTSRANAGFRPFAQFLVAGVNTACRGHSETNFSVEPGGGVDVVLNSSAALRAAVGFPMAFSEGSRVL